jgi:hypothetical protein
VLVIAGILTVLTPPAKPTRASSVAPTPAALHQPARPYLILHTPETN